MAFIVNQKNKRPNSRPDGTYVSIDGRSWIITGITISGSDHVCLHLNDPARYENQIVRACTLEDLVSQIPNATLEL